MALLLPDYNRSGILEDNSFKVLSAAVLPVNYWLVMLFRAIGSPGRFLTGLPLGVGAG